MKHGNTGDDLLARTQGECQYLLKLILVGARVGGQHDKCGKAVTMHAHLVREDCISLQYNSVSFYIRPLKQTGRISKDRVSPLFNMKRRFNLDMCNDHIEKIVLTKCRVSPRSIVARIEIHSSLVVITSINAWNI